MKCSVYSVSSTSSFSITNVFFFLNLPHCAQERFALHSLNVENKMNKSAKAILLITVSVLNNKYWKVAYGK